MKLDTDRIDEAVLALLSLGLHDGTRAWKSFFNTIGRLREFADIAAQRMKECLLTSLQRRLGSAKGRRSEVSTKCQRDSWTKRQECCPNERQVTDLPSNAPSLQAQRSDS